MGVVSVFGASVAERGSPLWVAAARCGRLLAEADVVVATGGYGGVMEAVSAGAAAAGGEVVGVTAPAVFPGRIGANGFVTLEHQEATIGSRIARLVEIADACIALPGSLGTATELLVAWNYAYVAQFSGRAPKPLYAVGDPWTTLVPTLVARLDADPGLVTVVDDVDTAVAAVIADLGGADLTGTESGPPPAGS